MLIEAVGLESIEVKDSNFSGRSFLYKNEDTGEVYYIFLVNVFGCNDCWPEVNHRNFMLNYNDISMTIDGYSKSIFFKRVYSLHNVGKMDVEKHKKNIENALQKSVHQFKDSNFIEQNKLFNEDFFNMVLQHQEYNNLFVSITEKNI